MKMIILAIALVLGACATVPNEPLPPVPTCSGEADCTAKWEAAQLFVVKHADQKIQISTSVLIETYNPSPSTNIAMRITKEPLGGGAYRLVAVINCANPFGCSGSPRELLRMFNITIAATTP